MSLEETQTAAPSADTSVESTSVNTGTTSVETSGEQTSPEVVEARAQAQASSAQEAVKEAPPAFTPNFKYRAALQDREIDEFWRPLIKDADSEKKVIEAMQLLDGFPMIRESREKLSKEYQSLQGDYQTVHQEVSRFNEAIEKGDLTSAFRQIGLNDNQIFKWVQDRINYMELPPEQKRAIEESEKLRQQQWSMEQEKTQYQKMYEEQSVQTRTLHLDFVLSRPEVSQSASHWDSVMGPGAFRNLVVSEAQNLYYQTGQDLSADQAVQLVMQKFGKVMGNVGGSTQPQAGGMQQQSSPQAKPVIPNVSGKNASPIKKQVKSLDDIKRIAKDMDSADNNSNY